MAARKDRVEGRVSEPAFLSPTGRRIFRVNDVGGRPVLVVSKGLQPVKGERVVLEGKWDCEDGLGRCFIAEDSAAPLPQGMQAATAYLMKGLGVTFGEATNMMGLLGERVFQVLDDGVDTPLVAAGFQAGMVRDWMSRWKGYRAQEASQGLFERLRMSPEQVEELRTKLGSPPDLDSELRRNPYLPMLHLKSVDWFFCERLADELKVDIKSQDRLMASVLTVLRRRARSGHTYVPKDLLRKQSAELCGVTFSESSFDTAFKLLMQRLLVAAESGRVYMPEHFTAAAEAAARVQNARTESSNLDAPEDYEGARAGLQGLGVDLQKSEFEALAKSLARGLSLIDARGPEGALRCGEMFLKLTALMRIKRAVVVPSAWLARKLKASSPSSAVGTAWELFGSGPEGDPNWESVAGLDVQVALVLGAEQLSLEAVSALLNKLKDRALILCGDRQMDVGMIRGRAFRELLELAEEHRGWLCSSDYGLSLSTSTPAGALRRLAAAPELLDKIEGQLGLPVSWIDCTSEDTLEVLKSLARDAMPVLGVDYPKTEFVTVSVQSKMKPRPAEINEGLREALNPGPVTNVGLLRLNVGDPVTCRMPVGGSALVEPGVTMSVDWIHGADGPVSATVNGERVMIAGPLLLSTSLAYVRGVSQALWQRYQAVALVVPDDAGGALSLATMYSAACMAEKHLFLVGKKDAVLEALKRTDVTTHSLFRTYISDSLKAEQKKEPKPEPSEA